VALAQAARDAGIAALWTSPLRRARDTAAIVGERLRLEATVLQGLIESDRGAWEGEPIDEIVSRTPRLYDAFVAAQEDFVFPGGESLADQVARTCDALDVIAAGAMPALVVAHAGTIRAALIALGRPVPPERALAHGQIVPIAWGR
jgi:broad specificity phosphatase PhoE